MKSEIRKAREKRLRSRIMYKYIDYFMLIITIIILSLLIHSTL